MDARDISADGAKFFYDALVAAVDVVDAVDESFAAGDQAGEDQAGAGAEVRGLHGGAGKLRRAADYGAAAVDGNVGAHAHHFAGETGVFLGGDIGGDEFS